MAAIRQAIPILINEQYQLTLCGLYDPGLSIFFHWQLYTSYVFGLYVSNTMKLLQNVSRKKMDMD